MSHFAAWNIDFITDGSLTGSDGRHRAKTHAKTRRRKALESALCDFASLRESRNSHATQFKKLSQSMTQESDALDIGQAMIPELESVIHFGDSQHSWARFIRCPFHFRDSPAAPFQPLQPRHTARGTPQLSLPHHLTARTIRPAPLLMHVAFHSAIRKPRAHLTA